MLAMEFLLLADQLPEGMLLVAADGEVLAVNRVAAQLLKCSPEQLTGHNLAKLIGLKTDELLTKIKPCLRSRNPVRLSLKSSNPDAIISLPACEGFLSTPVKDGQLAQWIIRLGAGIVHSDRFKALNKEIDKYRELLKKLQQSRDSLYLSEKNMSITLDSIGDAVMVTDEKGRIVSLNPVAQHLTGWSIEAARGLSVKTIFPIIDATTREPIENPVEKVLATGETVYLSNHTTLIAKNGNEYQIADSAAPIREQNSNEIKGMVLVFNDVTEQYRLRQENIMGRLFMQEIIDNMPAVVCVKDVDGRYNFTNKQFAALFNLKKSAVLGKTVDDLFPIDLADRIRSVDNDVLVTGRERVTEEVMNHGDEPCHYMVVRFPLRDSDNKIYAVCCIATDMTQRIQDEIKLQESEKLYRGLIETAAAVAWEFDLKNEKYSFMGPQILQLTGYPAEQWTDFVFWLSKIHPEDRDAVNELCNAEMAEGNGHSFEYRMITADGKIIWIRDEVSVVVAQGQAVALRGYFFDVTRLKQTEQALRRSQKMDAIGQLTGGIAHDFNNILSIILGNLSLMQVKVEVSDKEKKRFETINHAVQRASNLTQQLLNFSRVEATIVKVVNINRVIVEMNDLISQSLTPEVEVEQQMDEALWSTMVDSGDFEDVLVNLAINARDAMNGHGRLTIETQNCTLDKAYCMLNPAAVPGDYVQLVVSDTGEGMSPEQQEKIFEPFYTTKEQGKGTGLGLSMVFGFVKRSGGTIRVYSELGIGTTFRIYLPRASADGQAGEDIDEQARVMPRGQETILAVDDEIALLDLVYETLTSLGYVVLVASNASRAQALFAQSPEISLLFSDVVMPGGINGFELAEQLCNQRPELKVLLTSGYTEKAVARNGQGRFRANMLSKPYTLVDLAQRIRNTLDTLVEQ